MFRFRKAYLRFSRSSAWIPATIAAVVISLMQLPSQTASAQNRAVAEAQQQKPVAQSRPEQQKNEHDRSQVFAGANASPSSTALTSQPEKGEFQGFDFSRDPLDAKRPMQTAEEIMQEDIRMKPQVMQLQKQLLESRYDLSPRFDSSVKMSRGKPICVGPTARLKNGLTWTQLADMAPEQIKTQNAFPYPALPIRNIRPEAWCSRRW